VQPDSASERMLAQSGVPFRCVYPGSAPREVDNTMDEFFRILSQSVAVSPWFEEQFNAKNQTRMLDTNIQFL
jgi:hypothetical protein